MIDSVLLEIERLISEGVIDPEKITSGVIDAHGKRWLREQADLLVRAQIYDLAAKAVGAHRRDSEEALSTGNTEAVSRSGYWVPGPDGVNEWKLGADLTAADLRARAEWYEKAAASMSRRARWCRAAAAQIDREGCGVLGKLSVVPPMPDAGSELGEAA